MFFIIANAPNSNNQYNEFSVSGQSNIIDSNNIAERVHKIETLEILPGTDSFIMLIANEAHESWNDERHKLITDKNSYNIPSNLVIYKGTKLVFINADAPWDTPHPQNIELVNIDKNKSSDEPFYSTGVLDYTHSSEPINPPVGRYSIINTEYDTKERTITLLESNPNSKNTSSNNLVIGGFYTPTALLT